MYERILVTLDGTPTDRGDHRARQATRAPDAQPRRPAARRRRLGGADVRSGRGQPGSQRRRRYLDAVRAEFEAVGMPVETVLAYGDPARKSSGGSARKGCDLVAMSTHGHRFFGDLFLGTTASRVQHQVSVPVLLLRTR